MKKLNKGFTLVELLVVIGILGVLMGTLFPAITGAMRSANMTACMQNGKNLHTAIFTRNTARDSLGLGSVWPQNGQTESSEDDDISAMSFNNSADYFTELFDLANAGDSQNHKPEIEVDMKLLWGFGVNPPRAVSKRGIYNVLDFCQIGSRVNRILPEVKKHLPDFRGGNGPGYLF